MTVTQASTDLALSGSFVTSANVAFAAGQYAQAIHGYQQAGTVAQSIRSDLGDPTDANLDYADANNQALQAISQTSTAQADAQQAKDLMAQVTQGVSGAITTASQSQAITAPSSTPLPANFWWTALALTVGVAGLGWVAWRVFFNRGSKARARENPSGRKGKSRSGSKALINKGKNAEFEMKDGSEYHARGGMLHDPSGRYWPKNSVLFGPYKSGSKPSDGNAQAEHYLARKPREGSIDTPTRELASWKYLGEVDEIFYTRTGNRKPGRYVHKFNKPGALTTVVMGKGRAKLYRLGKFYRLQLPRNAILDSRGLVWP